VKHDTTSRQQQGFVKLMRSPFTIELLRDLLAFGLLALIAFRARWRSGFSTDGLEIGEALIGDYKNCGMTRSEYREGLARLVKWGLVTARPTNKGTIAKLASNAVFDINIAPPSNHHRTAKKQPSEPPTDLRVKTAPQPPTKPPTNRQPTANQPPLTNNDKKERKKEYQGKALGNSTPSASSNGKSDFGFEDYQNQSMPAQQHVKWPEFAAWCRSKRDKRGNPGTPTEPGFRKWLNGQKPQWRDKVRQKFDGEEGYELAGKFFTRDEANQRGAKDPKLIEQFRKAVRRDNKIEIIPP
jgi:hypothetical protein